MGAIMSEGSRNPGSPRCLRENDGPSGKPELPGAVLLNGDVRRGLATVRRGAMERVRDEGQAAVSSKTMEARRLLSDVASLQLSGVDGHAT